MLRVTLYIFLLSFFIGSCTLPASESLRPRDVDIYIDGGQSRYKDNSFWKTQGRSNDWRVGTSVHFDITYEDETSGTPE